MTELILPKYAYEGFQIQQWLENIKQQETNKSEQIRFSFWSYSLFNDCPLKYQGQVLFKQKPPMSKNILPGIVLHDLMRDFLLKSGTQDLDWLYTTLESMFEECAIKNEIEFVSEEERTRLFNESKSNIDYVYNYFKGINGLFENYNIKGVEYTFSVRVFPNVDITGRMDLWLSNKKDGKNYVLDYKGSKEEPSSSDQLKFYSLYAINQTGQQVDLAIFIMTRLKRIVKYRFNENQYLYFLKRIQNSSIELRKCLQNNIFPPTPSKHSCMFCANTECQYHRNNSK